LVTMWRYEPVAVSERQLESSGQLSEKSLDYGLAHFDGALTRLLRR